MTNQQEIFTGILKDVLKINPKKIRDFDSVRTIKNWNSMNHMKMITTLESAFDIHFEVKDVIRIRTIGDLKNLLHRHDIQID